MSEFVATVVMPVRNEEHHIGATLDAVLAQEVTDGSLEILVVDGMSDDRTREIVEGRSEGARFPVRVIDNPGRIAATAMNIGVREVASDVIVRVDGHVEIPPVYVRELLAALERSGADVAGGSVRPVGEDTFSESVACAMRSPLGHGGARFRAEPRAPRPVDVDVDTVAFPAYRREALDAVGGFDEDMVRNQDDDLHLRLRRAGKRIVLVQGLVTTYRPRRSWRGLFRQFFGYGRWKVVGWRKTGRLSTVRAVAPAAVVAWLAAWALLGVLMFTVLALTDPAAIASHPEEAVSRAEHLRAAVLIGLVDALFGVCVYALPVAFLSLVFTPWPPGWRWLRVPPALILMTMHIAYGLGFWWGVVTLGRPPRADA